MGERIKFFETNTKESIKRGNGDTEQAKKIKSKVINGSPNISIIPVNRPKALITDQKNDKTGQKDKPHYILFTRDEEHLQRKEAERLKEGGLRAGHTAVRGSWWVGLSRQRKGPEGTGVPRGTLLLTKA